MPTISIVKGQELLFIGDEYRLKTQVDSAPQDILNFREKQEGRRETLSMLIRRRAEAIRRSMPELETDAIWQLEFKRRGGGEKRHE